MVLTDCPEKFRLQSIFQGGVPQVGIRIRSERTRFDIAFRADMDKTPASRQAAANFFFVAWNGNKKSLKFKPKRIPYGQKTFSLFFRQNPVFGSFSNRGVFDKKEQFAPLNKQVSYKLGISNCGKV